ncbi:MAG: hypothetical protein O3B05_03675 [archaeon]|nr:hypothetical protein [archaeon]
MDNFEYLTVSYVLITGIGMSRLFISLGSIVEERAVLNGPERPRLHWMLTMWILLLIAIVSLTWHAFYKWNVAYDEPTVELSPFSTLALTLLAGGFYILMELASPEASEDGTLDMERHFLLIRSSIPVWVTVTMLSMILAFMSFSHDVTGSFTEVYRTSTAARLGLYVNIGWIAIVTPLYLPAHHVRDAAVVLTGFGMVVGMTLGTPTYALIEDDPDLDGVIFNDLCEDSDDWFWEPVDRFGCTTSQLDTNADGSIDDDGDGVYDRFDACAGTPQGQTVGPDGCPSGDG